MKRQLLLAALLLGTISNDAVADVIAVAGGTGSPASTLGPYAMTPFPADTQPLASVTEVPTPVGGDVIFSPPLTHAKVGNGYGTWGNGYTGDVYKTSGSIVELTLPENTFGFYLYTGPHAAGNYEITAIGIDGKTATASINSAESGATYYGFYGTDGDAITRISVSAPTVPGGFAIGEFGIDPVPEPSTFALLGVAAVGLLWRCIRRKR